MVSKYSKMSIVAGVSVLLCIVLPADEARAVGIYQRPAFEDFSLRLDFSPASAPGHGGRYHDDGFIYRERDFAREPITSLGGGLHLTAFEIIGLEVGFEADEGLESLATPRFGAALGHSFEDGDLGVRFRYRSDDDPLSTRADINAFGVLWITEAAALELVTGLAFAAVPRWPDHDVEGDFYAHPRLMIQPLDSLGAAFGILFPLAGKSGLEGRIHLEVVYTVSFDVLDLDIAALVSYESSRESEMLAGAGVSLHY